MKKKILIIEDEKDIREMLHLFFILDGYEPLTASDGYEAIELVQENLFDLIISDLHMPFMDGFVTYQKIRQFSNYAKVPYIFVSATNDIRDIDAAIHMGASAFVRKPFDCSDLVDTVRNLLFSQPEPSLTHLPDIQLAVTLMCG